MEKPYECDVKKRDGRKLDHLHFLSRRKRTLICVHAQLLLRACARLPQWCLTLCDPTVCSTPGSPIRGNFQQEYWSGLVCPPPGNLPDPGIQSASPALAGRFFTTEPPGKTLNTNNGQWEHLPTFKKMLLGVLPLNPSKELGR